MKPQRRPRGPIAHPLGHNDALPAVSADVTCWRSTEYCQNHSSSSNVTVGQRAGSSGGPHAFRAGPAVDQISAILIASDLTVT